MRPIDPPPPARLSLETLMAERVGIYAHFPLPVIHIPIGVAPFPVDDTIPGEEEIPEAVMRLRLHFTGSPSGIRAKHLRLWLRTAKREEHADLGNWEKVIAIIQADFRGGELAAPFAWQTVVMIPKGGGTDFSGIGLVEVLWKAISIIINR